MKVQSILLSLVIWVLVNSCIQRKASDNLTNSTISIQVENPTTQRNDIVQTNNLKQIEAVNSDNYISKLKDKRLKIADLPQEMTAIFCDPECYALVNSDYFFVVITDDICGDFLTTSISTIDSNNKLIDSLIIGSEWYEPDNKDEYLKKETFDIDTNCSLKVMEVIVEFGKITSSKASNYSINKVGKIINMDTV